MMTLSKTVPTFTCVKLKIGSQGEVFFGSFSYMFTAMVNMPVSWRKFYTSGIHLWIPAGWIQSVGTGGGDV